MTDRLAGITEIFLNRVFANFFSSVFSAGITSYSLNLFLAWKLGIQGYSDLTVLVLFAFFVASLSELGFNQFYIARMSNQKRFALGYLSIRLVFALLIYIFCVGIGVTDADGSLAILICGQAAIHVLNSALEKNGAFSGVSRAAYMGAGCRLLIIGVIAHAETVSVSNALTCLTVVVCVQLTSLAYAFLAADVAPAATEDGQARSISGVYVVLSFVTFLLLGRLDLFFLEYLEWGNQDLNAFYFAAVGILFPLNQFFQVFARYSMIALQRSSVSVNDGVMQNVLLALAVFSISAYGSGFFLFTTDSMLLAQALIFLLMATGYFVSGTSAIFALGIYSADNGFQLTKMAVIQFLVSIILIYFADGELLALMVAAVTLLANSIGCAIVIAQYKQFQSAQIQSH